MLTRDYLSHKADVTQRMIAKSCACLFKSEGTKQTVAHLMQKFEDDRPQVTDEMKKNKQFPDHPSGCNRKQTYMFTCAMVLLEQEFEGNSEVGKKRAEWLRTLPIQERDQVAAIFKPKFNAPKENRTWKFDWVMSDFVLDTHRIAVAALVSAITKKDNMTVEYARQVPQPDSEAALWGWLKKQAR